jgi:hypothetical protein
MTGMARVSVWDEPKGGRIVPPPTLPPVNLSDLDIEREAKEAAARVAERRIIRTGLDAWREINRAESFDGWRAIGAALHVGKLHALKVTQANAPWGSAYSREFGRMDEASRLRFNGKVGALRRYRTARECQSD